MSTNNPILASDNQPEIIKLPEGIPAEQEIKPVGNNQEPQNPEAERILSPNAQQPIEYETTQECQGANTRMFTKKTSILFLIDCSIKIIFFLIQFYMLGFMVTSLLIGLGLASYVMGVICLSCEYICSGLDQGSCLCPNIYFKMSILPCIGAFVLSILYPVRYTFKNPEAIDIVKVYTRLYYFHSDDESSANSSSKSVADVYYLHDVCKEIFHNSVQNELEQSSFDYCHKLMDGIIQENNFQNLNAVQILIMVLFGLALIFLFFIIYLQHKNTKQYLSCYPIAPKFNDSDLS